MSTPNKSASRSERAELAKLLSPVQEALSTLGGHDRPVPGHPAHVEIGSIISNPSNPMANIAEPPSRAIFNPLNEPLSNEDLEIDARKKCRWKFRFGSRVASCYVYRFSAMERVVVDGDDAEALLSPWTEAEDPNEILKDAYRTSKTICLVTGKLLIKDLQVSRRLVPGSDEEGVLLVVENEMVALVQLQTIYFEFGKGPKSAYLEERRSKSAYSKERPYWHCVGNFMHESAAAERDYLIIGDD